MVRIFEKIQITTYIFVNLQKKSVIFLLVFLATTLITACALRLTFGVAKREAANGPDSLVVGKVLVVGKIVLDPPMPQDKQKLDLLGSGGYRHLMRLICKDKLMEIDERYLLPESGYFEGGIEAPMGKTFYALSAETSFYIDIKPGDKAVYIGTIKYSRDNFYNVTKIRIIDEYDREMPGFRRKFGAINLRKTLIRQPSEDAIFKIGLIDDN